MKEIYVALSGAIAREQQSAIVANNLANVNAVGFKKDSAVFQVRPPEPRFDLMMKSADPDLEFPEASQRIDGNRNYVRLAESVVDYSSGAMRMTDRPLDMALDARNPRATGAAFFAVETTEGTRLTRMGNFQVNSDGEIVTPDGLPVEASGGGRIRLEQDAARPVGVAADGTISRDGRELGRVRVVVAERPEALVKQGDGLFHDAYNRAGVRDATPDDGFAVRQNFLEMSNVNAVEELVKMIEIQRAYTTFTKSMQSMDEASGRVITQVLNG